jgi:hypothetical protein
MRTAGVLIVISALLTGCAVLQHDRTDAPGMDALVGKSFVIQKDSFLIENYCLSGYPGKACLFLQVTGGKIERNPDRLGGYRMEADLPASFADYASHADSYNGDLVERSIFGSTLHDILANVPKGTIITLTTVIDQPAGDNGSCLVAYGTIPSQPGVSIQIGPCPYVAHGSPEWFDENSEPLHLRPLPEYLQPVTP